MKKLFDLSMPLWLTILFPKYWLILIPCLFVLNSIVLLCVLKVQKQKNIKEIYKKNILKIILFSFVSNWNEYFWPLVMTNSTAVRPLTVGVAMLKDVEGMVNWHVIMAGNMILVFPILLVYLFASKYIIKAFTYSGIK